MAGVLDLAHILILVLGLPTRSQVPASVVSVSAILYLIVGLLLLIGANLITRLIYGRSSPVLRAREAATE